MKKEMKKISVFLSFLLCWSFVSSNPHHEKSNYKSADELNQLNVNSGSDILNLARKESADEASSGKDWGGNFFDFLNFLSQKDQKDIDENDQADNKSFLDTLISQGSKFIKTLIPKDKLSDNTLFGNFITWIQKNVEALGKLFTNEDQDHAVPNIKKCAYTDEKIEKHSDRVKRDLGTSAAEYLRTNSHKGGISEHILKLSRGRTSNVLKSEKATVAEALNGRTAIRRILAEAKAKAAKAAEHKNLYDNDDFNKWFLSGSAFDTDIFNHPFRRPSYNTKITRHSEAENTNGSRHRTFSASRHVSEPADHHHHHEIKHAFNTMSDTATVGTAGTERSYTKLLHKPEHQKHLSSKLQITSGEERGRETNGMFHKPTVSQHTHRSLSHEDEENAGLQHASSHAHIPGMYLSVTEDEETGNGVPKWRHAKWIHTDSSKAHAPDYWYFIEPQEYETSDEMERYGRRFIFRTSFEPGSEREEIEGTHTGHRRRHKISDVDIDYEFDYGELDDDEAIAAFNSHERTKLGHERYYYDIGDREYSAGNKADTISFDGTKNRRLADEPSLEHDLSIRPHREENIRNKNKRYNLDGVQHSAIYSTKSAETKEGIEEEQSGDMLITKNSTGTPTRPTNIDIERYHSRNQNVAANGAASSSSSLSDEKGSKHTNNVLASPSVDDGSVAVKMKTENDYGDYLGGTRPVIDNDATSAEIEMGFSGIKSHPPADLPLAHSSPSRAHSKIHLGNEKVHHSISGYQHSTVNTAASSETKHSTDAKMPTESRNKNHDIKRNQETSASTSVTAEATTSVKSERQHGLFRAVSSDDSREEDYTKVRKKSTGLKGSQRATARHKTSIEVIDIDDRSAEVLIPEFHKFEKGHAIHDVNYYDWNGQGDREIEADESAAGLKKSEIDYDGLKEEENIAGDAKMSKESKMIVSNERGSHTRHSHSKDDKHDGHNYRSHHSERNHHMDHGQYNNVRNKYSQHNHHVFNQNARDMTSSSIASDANEFETLNKYKYLYFVREREEENDESDASLGSSTSVVKKTKKQNNVMDEKISSLHRQGKKHMTDSHVHLKKYKNIPDPNTYSTEINKIISIKNNGETDIKSGNVMNNRNKNHKTVTRTGSLISDGSTIDTASHTSSSEKISNKNQYHQQASMESISLKNSRADIQTETERIYDAHDRKKKVDINTKRIAETVMQSTDSKSNLQGASSKISMSETDSKVMAREQATNEKVLSSHKTNRYQDHNDLREISTSSGSIAKSQMETKHRSNKKSKNNHKVNPNVETLTEITSASDAVDKSRSNMQNTISSSKLSEKSRNVLQHNWNNFGNNKKYITKAEAPTDATISVDVKNKKESVTENALSFSKSKAEIDNRSDTLKNIWMNTINSEALSEPATKSSIESEMKIEQKLDDSKKVQIDTNMGISSTAISSNVKNERLFSSSDESQIDYRLTNYKDNQINAISKTSMESSKAIKDENRSHLQKLFSSSSAMSEKSQTESEHNSNNLRNSQMSASTAESSSIKSTSFSDTKNEHDSDSNSSLSPKLLEKAYMKNKQYSNDMRADHKKNIITKTGTASSGIIKNHRQQESISSSSSHTESQVENKNIKTLMSNIISNNIIGDMDQRNLLYTSTSSQNADKNNSNKEDDPQIASGIATLTTSTHIKNDNHRRKDNILKTKWLDLTNKHNIKRFGNNKSIRKGEFIKQNSENALNALKSIKTVTPTDIKNIKNVIATSSSIDSKAETWTRNEDDLNQLKEGKIIIDDSVTGTSNKIENKHKNGLLRTSFLSGSHSTSGEKKKNHIDNIQNNQESIATTARASSEFIVSSKRRSQNGLGKEITLSESIRKAQEKQNNFDVSKENAESAIKKIATDKTANIIKNVYQDNLMKITSAISHEKMQTGNKLNDEIGVIAADSGTENKINSRVQMKALKGINNVNEMISKESTILNNFNSENRNNKLKLTSSDKLYAEMSRGNEYKSNLPSDTNEIINTNVLNKDRHKLISSMNTKPQSMIDHKSKIGATRNNKVINSMTHNNINDWHTKFQTTESCAELRNKGENAVKTLASVESMVNSVNKDARNYNPMQEKSLFDPTDIAHAKEIHNYVNRKAKAKEDTEKVTEKTSKEISSSNIPQIERKYDARQETSVASQLNHRDLNVQRKDKAITSNMLLQTEGANSGEMRNAHRALLESVTSSNSHTKVQHEHISDIVKESSEIAANAATSARATSFGKVESESQEKLIRNSAKSNSYAKSRIRSNNDPNVSKEKQITASIEMSANSAVSNNLKNVRQDKLIEKSLLFDSDHDTYMENQNRNAPKNNLANTAIVSAKDISSSVIKGEHQSGVTTASNSHAEVQMGREYDPSFQQGSIEMVSFRDTKNQMDGKNAIKNREKNLKTATNTVTFADAISSSSIENMSKQDALKISSSSNSYSELRTGNTHTRNVARENQESAIAQTSAISLISPFAENHGKREDNFMKEILRADPQDQRMTKIENNDNNILKKNLHKGEDIAASGQAISFSNIKNGHQDNLLKATSLVKSFVDARNIRKNKSSILKNKDLITTHSSSNSKISVCKNGTRDEKNEELIATSSSNSYKKSSAQNKNHINVLKKHHTDVLSASTSTQTKISSEDAKRDKSLQMTSSDSYAEAQMKNKNANGMKEDPDAVVNTKIKTISPTHIKGIGSHSLLDLLANPATKKMQTKTKRISQEDVKKIKKGLLETSSDSKAHVDSKSLRNSYENSATADTITKMKNSSQREMRRRENLQKIKKIKSSSTQDSRHDIKSMSSANSYITSQATSEDIAKSEEVKEDREVTVNLSASEKVEAHNKVKGARSYDWLVATPGATALAEERAQNKDKFNVLGEAEEVAVCAGTSAAAAAAAADNIEGEQHDIHAENLSDLRDDATKNIQDAVAISSTSTGTTVPRGTKNKSESKDILDDKLTTFNDAYAEINDKEKCNVSGNSESFVNTEGTLRSITSAMSSASASASVYDNRNMRFNTRYDKINDEISTASAITSVSKDTEKTKSLLDLSSIETSLHPPDKINRCNKDAKTRKFISKATSLYKMLGKQGDSEVLLMKKNSEGPVQIANLKNSVPPLIAYRLIPREVYERIRTIIANKQILCADCPLSRR